MIMPSVRCFAILDGFLEYDASRQPKLASKSSRTSPNSLFPADLRVAVVPEHGAIAHYRGEAALGSFKYYNDLLHSLFQQL